MNMKFRCTLLLCLLGAALLVRAPLLFADIYQYTDSRGVVSMTNTLESVPPKYRATMKVVREAPKNDPAKKVQQAEQEPAAPAAAETEAAAPARAPVGKFAELSARFVWFKPLVYLCGIFAALLLVIKITSLLPSPQLAKVIYLSFFLGVFVFLYKAYVSHMVESTLKVKDRAMTMMKKSSLREAPAATGDEATPAKQ